MKFKAMAVAPNGAVVYLTIDAKSRKSAKLKARSGCKFGVFEEGGTWKQGTKYTDVLVSDE